MATYLFGLFSYPCLDSLGTLTAKRLEHSPGHALDMQTRDAVRREALWFQVHEDQASASIHSKGGDPVRSRLPEVSCAALRSFPRALSVGALLVNERTAAPHEHVSALVLFTCHTKKSKLTRLPDASPRSRGFRSTCSPTCNVRRATLMWEHGYTGHRPPRV